MAAKGGEIGPTTWSKWRVNASAVKGAQSISQRQAAIVLYQACFSFSGKFVAGRMYKDIASSEWPTLTEAWLAEMSDIHVEQVLAWIRGEGRDGAKKPRPVVQRFLRSVFTRTVLKPVPKTKVTC
jgi:hypothetical protein